MTARGATRTMTGIVLLVQESRFQLRDDAGVAHMFILGSNAAAEPAQLAALQRRQARVEIRYTQAPNLIGHSVSAITLVQ
jgi:hypothetical protein